MVTAPATTTLWISNLHCGGCSTGIFNILSNLSPAPINVSVSTVQQIVTVTHSTELTTGDIVDALLDAAFEVGTVAVGDDEQHAVFPKPAQTEDPARESPDVGGWLHDARRRVRSFVSSNSFRSAKRRRHLDICEVCREEADEKSSQFSEDSFDKPESFVSAREPFTAISNPGITAFPATPPTTTAPLIGAQNETLTEKGLSADAKTSVVIDLDPSKDRRTVTDGQSQLSTYEALFSIGGMTCGVCTGKVTETVEYFPWVKEARINLVSNSGLIVFESSEGGTARAAELLDEIESIGYDANLEDLKCVDGPASMAHSLGERKLALRIDGLYCDDCAPKIVEALQTTFPDLLKIEQLPLLSDRILKVSYVPRPPQFTVRSIIAAISSIDQRYQPSVHRPPSIEERSIQILREELRRYLRRLIVAVICAIPAFLLGIVWMSFVSSTNRIRQFLEQPMWVGSASRVEWALLFVSTPVMFYSANLFHTRAIREIIAQWRPGSTVPLSKRFYRFGSMNLLVSLGVTISYVASVAMLTLAALTPAHRDTMAHTTTYFDSTVLLTMFLLMGRCLETYSKSRTAEGLSSLNFIRTKEAVLVEPQSEDNEAKAGFGVLSGASPIGDAENNPEYQDNRAARTRRISVEELDVGDTVRIAQGSSPPADSVVITGTSSFDESSLSGESQLVSKEPGDIVYAGTVNHGQVINARVFKASGDCMIDDVVKLVREGQNRQAPIERLADKLTAYFVPIICLIAVATWFTWLSLGLSGRLPDNYLDIDQGGWYFWSLSFAIAVFVVACPCGIALAAPMALYVGTALAAKEFILARGGGEAFEEGSRLDYIVFDKTGTLTKGVEPVITDEALVLTGNSASRIAFSILELLEEGSSHPLARSIVSYCRAKQSASGRCVDMKEIPGKGSKGTLDVEGVTFEAVVGNERFMEEHGVIGLAEHLELLESWKKDGKSVILLAMRAEGSPVVGREFTLAALFATTDPLREEAPLVISALKRSGIDVWMITGDNAVTATAMASQVGIPSSRVIAGVLPAEKAEKVCELQANGIPRYKGALGRFFHQRGPGRRRALVGMVGDGINDAPALAMADVGIAIGSGSDIAQQMAKFVLISSDLRCLVTLLDLSRIVTRRITLNFVWACIFNVVAIPIAAGMLYPTNGHPRLPPIFAALAMALSSLCVVGSSYLLCVSMPVVGFKKRAI